MHRSFTATRSSFLWLTPAVDPHSEHSGQYVGPQDNVRRVLHQSCCVFCDRNIIALSCKASKVMSQLCLLTASDTLSACLLGEQSYREGLDAVQTLLIPVWYQHWVRHRPKTQHSTGCHGKGNTWTQCPWKHSGWPAPGLTTGLTHFNSSFQNVSSFSG